MVDLQKLRQVYNYVQGIQNDPMEDPVVRAKAQEIIALFDSPSLAELQSAFQKGNTATKLGALGSLQSSIIRGFLSD